MRTLQLVIMGLLLCAPVATSGQGPEWWCASDSSIEPNIGGPVGLFVCPQGDTESFIEQGWMINVRVVSLGMGWLENIPPSDMWLVDCDPNNEVSLCGGHLSSNADSATNASGLTTFSLGTLAAGGCANGVVVVVKGSVFYDEQQGCAVEECLPIHVRSPDINGDLAITLADLTLFSWTFPPQPYGMCGDMNADGTVSLADLSLFSFHFGPPGHACQ